MQIIIHRGTHQIGGVATEIRTNTTRILIDIGDELSLDENFNPAPLSIPGVTDTNGNCDAVLKYHCIWAILQGMCFLRLYQSQMHF